MILRSVVRTSSGGSRRRPLRVSVCVGAIVLVALMVSIGSLASAATTSFPDVPASHQYCTAITHLASRSIIGGYANGDFGPSDPVTRQQFAKMIVLTGGYPVSESDVCSFTDVQKSDVTTFYPDNFVAVCAAHGITTGKTATTFDPSGKITRYQVISMVVRMADNLQLGLLATPPAGWAGNATWANNATHGANAARAEYNGILAGLDLAALSPSREMNRGEVAQVLHNLLGKLTPTTATTTTTTEPPNTWTNLNPGGSLPSARSGNSMVYDSRTGKVVLFGGRSGDSITLNDTWAYDPTANAWTKLNPAGGLPFARSWHSTVYDPANGKVVLFGGTSDGSAALGDTWAYDPTANTWTNLNPGGILPSARSGHSMAYDSANGQVILFGGHAGDFLNDTWAYDPTANTWTNLNPAGDLPPVRQGHCVVYDSETGQVILFGGQGNSAFLNDTWAYDPTANTWTHLHPAGNLPSGRLSRSMVYDSRTGKVVLFGGTSGGGTYFNDTWAYDPTANTWANLNPGGALPSARSGHSMAYDSAGREVILFGGSVIGGPLNDTWAYGSQP